MYDNIYYITCYKGRLYNPVKLNVPQFLFNYIDVINICDDLNDTQKAFPYKERLVYCYESALDHIDEEDSEDLKTYNFFENLKLEKD